MLSATLLATFAWLALVGTDPARAAPAAETDQAPRPRIGLVLGG